MTWGRKMCQLCFSKMAIAIFPVPHTLPETCHSPSRDTVYNLSPCTWAALCASRRGWQKACDSQGWVRNSDVASTCCSLSGSQPLCSYEAHGEKLRPPASAPAELAANTDCQLTGHMSESSWEHVLQPPVYVAPGGATWSRNMPSRVSPAQMTNVWAKWMTVVVLSYYVLGNLVCRSR